MSTQIYLSKEEETSKSEDHWYSENKRGKSSTDIFGDKFQIFVAIAVSDIFTILILLLTIFTVGKLIEGGEGRREV